MQGAHLLMEVFRFLKTRRRCGGAKRTIASVEYEEDGDDDEGPFFDLFLQVSSSLPLTSPNFPDSDPNFASPPPISPSPKKHQLQLQSCKLSIARRSRSFRSARVEAEEGVDFPKIAIHSYLNKIKPLYTRASSKRYSTKLGFLGGSVGPDEHHSGESATIAGHEPQSGGVGRRLRKSRSTSAFAAAAPRSASAARLDDSLREKRDGIENAIAHCKKSLGQGSDAEKWLGRSRRDSGDANGECGDRV